GVPRGLSVLLILAGAGLAGWWLYNRFRPRSAHPTVRSDEERWRWLVGVGVALFGVAAFFLFERRMPAFIALAVTIGVMFVLAVSVEKLVLRPLVNQPDIILFMATF